MIVTRRKVRSWFGGVLVALFCLVFIQTTERITSDPSASSANVAGEKQSRESGKTVVASTVRVALPDLAPSSVSSSKTATDVWPVVRPVQGPQGIEVAAGELLVIPRSGSAEQLAARLNSESFVVAVRSLPLLGAYRVRVTDTVSLHSAINTVSSYKECERVTYNAVVRATGKVKLRKMELNAMWNIAEVGLNTHKKLQDPSARSEYVIALLDSGVATQSPGLSGVEMVNPIDLIDGDTTPQDENGHGTFLANLLVGTPGLARGAALMPVRILDENLIGTEASLVEGMRHATLNGADVINLSLVFGQGYMPTRLLDAAFADALKNDAVIVAAAGNSGQPMVLYPAAFPGVVSVGASTITARNGLTRSSYSAWGAALDLLAPGGDLSADVNGDKIPDGIIAESFDPANPTVFGPWLYAGTSQAAAHATAGAVWALADGVPRDLVHAALIEGAKDDTKLGTSGFDIETGNGYLQIGRTSHVKVRPMITGVQAIAVFRQEAQGKALGAVVTVVNEENKPVRDANVHGRFRGAQNATAVCNTDREGICLLDAGLIETSYDIATVVIEAVVLRDGRVSRPRTVASQPEIDSALEQTDGTGFGSSSILWYVDPSFARIWYLNALYTWLIFGTGDGSALAPTVLAVGEMGANELLNSGVLTEGSGFGSSSLSFWSTNWYSYYFLGGLFLGWPVYGGGFGSSSLTYIYWGGWAFLWTPFGIVWLYGAEVGGTPLHEIAGTMTGSSEMDSPIAGSSM